MEESDVGGQDAGTGCSTVAALEQELVLAAAMEVDSSNVVVSMVARWSVYEALSEAPVWQLARTEELVHDALEQGCMKGYIELLVRLVVGENTVQPESEDVMRQGFDLELGSHTRSWLEVVQFEEEERIAVVLELAMSIVAAARELQAVERADSGT